MNNEKEKALERFLGLSEEKPTKDDATLQNLQKIAIQTPVNDGTIDQSWYAIKRKLAQQPLKSGWYSLKSNKSRWISLSAAGSLALLFIVLIVSNKTGTEVQSIPLLVSSKDTKPHYLKQITTDDKILYTGKINENLHTKFKNIQSLSATTSDQEIKVRFKSGSLYTQYHSTQKNIVTVETNIASYTIVGTQFLINSSGKSDQLYVEKGKVKIKSKGLTSFVSKDQSWSSDSNLVNDNEAGVKRKLNHFFDKKKIKTKKVHIKKKIFIVATLASGEIFRGELISENATSIIFKSDSLHRKLTLNRSQILELKRIEKK